MTTSDRKRIAELKAVIGTRSAVHQKRPAIPSYRFRGDRDKVPSRDTVGGIGSPPKRLKYTGVKVVGVATMHKSNSVPVFSVEDAIAVAKMRRG